MLFLFAVLITLPLFSCSNPPEPGNTLMPFPDLSGPYLGQMLPDSVPELFAPGVVSTGMFTCDVAISPDGKEIYFWVVERNAEGWGYPQNLGEPVNTDGGEFFPSLTNEGTLYFTRNEKGSALNDSPGNGNADIYWVNAGFFRILKEKALFTRNARPGPD